MVVVEQPFRGGLHTTAAFQFRRAGAVGRQQDARVVMQSAMQRQDRGWMGRNGLGRRQRLRVLLQPFDAEQLLPDRCGVVPRGLRRATREESRFQPAPSWTRRSYSRSITGSREPWVRRLRTAASMSVTLSR